MKHVPHWLKKYLTVEEIAAIEQAVATAEQNTTGEIVPVIVHKSINIGHVPYLVFLFILLFLFTLIPVARQYLPFYPVWFFEIFAALVSVVFAKFLSRLDCVQRWFTSWHDQTASVMRRAQLQFYRSNIKNTKEGTGVLFFISVLERRAVILADEGIAKKLHQKVWQEEVTLMIHGIRSGKLSQGLCQAMQHASQHLQEHFPSNGSNDNELPNTLIVKE